jgi:hypothetical protein
MADKSKFEVYFLSDDILELIKNGATDIKISGTFNASENKFEIAAEAINTKTGDSTTRATLNTAPTSLKKFPCPMPCSSMQSSEL